MDPIVQISDGQLKGCVLCDYDGGKFYAFLGIPYAKPALGDLRFKAPVPADSWKGVRDATKDGDKCIQCDKFYQMSILEGSEDCLHLNVYTKQLLSDGKVTPKPVMAWIHGGGYMSGSNRSEMYGPDYLLTEDIVLVSINYRLGALGFLKIEDPSLEVYGNAGLKDQQLALKWIQNNIRAFGGDPNNVTIFGESCGASSVHFHVLSESSKGLFHKAIMQSGTVLNPWASQEKTVASAIELAQCLGKEVHDDKEALELLKEATVEELFEAEQKYFAIKHSVDDQIDILHSPIVEIPNDTAFLTQKPLEMLMSKNFNKVPVMFGFTRHEGMLYSILGLKNKEHLQPQPKLENVLPKPIREKENQETIQQLCKKLAEIYFTGENAKDKYKLASDCFFIVGIINSAKLHAKVPELPVYLYRMYLDDELNLFKKMKNVDLPGMSHADDLGYLFSNASVPRAKRGSSAETAMRRIVKLWTNFAKYGNPTTDEKELNVLWKPVDKDTINFLHIGSELVPETNPEPESVQLWNEINRLTISK